MFNIKITPVPQKPVIKGKPLYGAFRGAFSKFSVLSMRRPCFSMYLPRIFSLFRMRKTLCLYFSDQSYVYHILLLRTHFLSYAETIIWNKDTGQKYAYRQLLPARFINLPDNSEREITACRTSRRYIHIYFRRGKKDIEITIKIKGDALRPDIVAFLTASMDNDLWPQLSTCRPQQNGKWPVVSWMFASPLKGSLCVHTKEDAKHIFAKDSSLFFLDMKSGFYHHMTNMTIMTGFDIIDGHRISFQLTGSAPFADDNYADSEIYSDNALFFDDNAWILPPVYITFPFGIDGKWVIQDTENMVDLSFKPITDSHRITNLFFVKADYHTILGTFEGKIVMGDGNTIALHSFSGIGKKQLLRM